MLKLKLCHKNDKCEQIIAALIWKIEFKNQTKSFQMQSR